MQILVQIFYIFYLFPTIGASYDGNAVSLRLSKFIQTVIDARHNVQTAQSVVQSPIVTMHKVVVGFADCVGVG